MFSTDLDSSYWPNGFSFQRKTSLKPGEPVRLFRSQVECITCVFLGISKPAIVVKHRLECLKQIKNGKKRDDLDVDTSGSNKAEFESTLRAKKSPKLDEESDLSPPTDETASGTEQASSAFFIGQSSTLPVSGKSTRQGKRIQCF